MISIFLSYNLFRPYEIDSYLSLGVQTACYFKERGEHGEKLPWNHCGAIRGDGMVYEAKWRFTKHHRSEAFKHYEAGVILKPNFQFNEGKFIVELTSQLGKLYNFEAIGCQLIYQTTGWKPVKHFKRPYCSQAIAKAFYLSVPEGEQLVNGRLVNLRKLFENYDYMDPQDFVRLWKSENLFTFTKTF